MDLFHAMETFVAVCDRGGFSAAARTTRRSKATVSKLVAQLEDDLGARLLHRTTRRSHPTDEGRRYLEHCRAVIEEVALMKSELAHRMVVPRGLLRVNAPLSWGQLYMAPLVAGFLGRYGEVRLELAFTDRFVDLVEEGFDLAIRIGGDPRSRLIGRRLASIRNGLHASPAYLERHGRPERAADLTSHACLVYGGRDWQRAWWFGGQRVAPEPHLLSNNGEALRDAAVDGAGIASLPDFIVADALASGRLVCLEEEPERLITPVMAVYPERRHLPLKVRAFIDFLAERLERS